MSFGALLNQSITIENPTGPDAYGEVAFAAPATVAARFEKITKTRLLPTGESIVIDGRVFVPNVTVNKDARVVYAGANYKVINIAELVDGQGTIRHKELEVQSWRP